jgi:hypothetical protein
LGLRIGIMPIDALIPIGRYCAEVKKAIFSIFKGRGIDRHLL